ncbi:transcription factor HES-1-like isoform X2 [Daktulosphaira vitifoliae]|uniref:transcription factor HES-1-like isoform X2 n=1 Tax=Daktulosphaira vitifoliae TaxID=58002 RepID=UPI0021AAD64B|nr:transcription factor HES-1-like isoform X2 [Daktulosphaira vitifoliae]
MMTGKCEPDPSFSVLAAPTSARIHDSNNNAAAAATVTTTPVTATVHPFSKREPIVTSSSLVFSQTSNQKDGKRANKPLMEKRRRARINQSLALLKTLILDSTRTENTKHSKLEKADILELTVRHLQRQKVLSSDVRDKYRAGFQECAREVTRFLECPELHMCSAGAGNLITPGATVIEPAVKQRLLRHLDTCSSEIDLDFSNSTVVIPDDMIGGDEESNCSTADSRNDRIKSEPPKKRTRSRSVGVEDKSIDRSGLTASVVVAPSNDPTQPLSVVQLPDGQVVFLLPSHYVHCQQNPGGEGRAQGEEPIDFSVKREHEHDSMWRPW